MTTLIDLVDNSTVCFSLCGDDAAVRLKLRLLCRATCEAIERWGAVVHPGRLAGPPCSAFVTATLAARLEAARRPQKPPQVRVAAGAGVTVLVRPEVRGAYALCPLHRGCGCGCAAEVRLRLEATGAVTVRGSTCACSSGCGDCARLLAAARAAAASISSRFHIVRLHEDVHFSYAVAACGRVLLAGRSTAALLAPADSPDYWQTPPALALRDVSFAELSADGACAVLAVTKAGSVAAWGHDRGAWLGLGPKNGCNTGARPLYLGFFLARPVRSVALGCRSDPIALAVCCSGELYAWGGTGSVCTVLGAAARVVPWGHGRWRHHQPRLVTEATDLAIRCRTVEVAAPPCFVVVEDDRGRWFGGGLRLDDQRAKPLALLPRSG